MLGVLRARPAHPVAGQHAEAAVHQAGHAAGQGAYSDHDGKPHHQHHGASLNEHLGGRTSERGGGFHAA